ncbi:AraC family transcriptional regulator [uncultured Tateyamaria sp.]|uniref:AraC family transcriptional regulator n=1 Tax=Tateyamaria sp. 1078 TaxID=3417464 RepID=UPI00260A08EB|nr:AraC family transcriptional regulator [uncultured Tateyamaria sp.]
MRKDPHIRYKVARTVEQLCGFLGIEVGQMLQRMGRPPDFFETDMRGVTPIEYLEGWTAMIDVSGRTDAPLLLGQAYARGPFNSAFFAFTCSPTVAVGLERLALFKPLTGPLSLDLHRTDTGGLRVEKSSNLPGLPLPASFAATELVFLMEAIRICTGQSATAEAATLAEPVTCHAEIEAFIGCPITSGQTNSITLPRAVTDRRLLSSNADQWAQLEPSFRRQINLQREGQAVTARLRTALTEMLPAGEAHVNDAARRLHLSARSLQRHLKNEGTTFQVELNAMREALARQYLTSTDLNVAEISVLLAYRDPNSFYRAFQSWTGQTPGTVRAPVA